MISFKLANPKANTEAMDKAIPKIEPQTSESMIADGLHLDLALNLERDRITSITHDFDAVNKQILRVSSRLSVIYFSLMIYSLCCVIVYLSLVRRGHNSLCAALRVLIANSGLVFWCICIYFTFGQFADDYQRVCVKFDKFCIEMAVFWIDSSIRFKLNQMLDNHHHHHHHQDQNNDNDNEKD